jgi:hypothetical protein
VLFLTGYDSLIVVPMVSWPHVSYFFLCPLGMFLVNLDRNDFRLLLSALLIVLLYASSLCACFAFAASFTKLWVLCFELRYLFAAFAKADITELLPESIVLMWFAFVVAAVCLFRYLSRHIALNVGRIRIRFSFRVDIPKLVLRALLTNLNFALRSRSYVRG